MSEEAGYKKEINKILIKKVRDIEKLNETLELTMAKKEDDREEAVKVNNNKKMGKEQDLIQSRNTKNRLTAEAETEVQRRIDNKQGKVNKVCTKYVNGQECKYGETCKFIHKRIYKIYAKYGQCRFGQRCNFSHDLEGRCKREEEHGWCQYEKKCFMDTLGSMRQKTQAQNKAVKWKVEID